MAKSRGRGGGGSNKGGGDEGDGRKPLHALRKRGAPPQVAWQIDYDYAGKLSDEEKQWLNDFTGEYYVSNAKAKLHNKEQLRDRWAAYKMNQRDVTARDMAVPDRQVGREAGDNTNSLIELALENTGESIDEDDVIAAIDARSESARVTREAPVQQPHEALEDDLETWYN